jgi:hypothetical protein
LQVSAIHNHYLRDHPDLIFVHAAGLGEPAVLAQAVKQAWQAVHARVDADGESDPDDTVRGLDVQQLGSALGGTAEALDQVADVTVPRNESVTLQMGSQSVPLPSEMGPQSDLEFQPLGNGRAVVVGELCLTADEVQPVMAALRGAGLQVDALHNHFLTEQPRLFFLHLQAEGNAGSLAAAIRQALNLTNSKR